MSAGRSPALDAMLVDLDQRLVRARGSDAAFADRYWRDAGGDDLHTRRVDDVAGLMLAHLDLARARPDGTLAIDVYTPTVAEHGWATGHTVVQVVVEDMPLLVDSVMAALTSRGHVVHDVLHPVLAVRRDVTGAGKLAVRGDTFWIEMQVPHRADTIPTSSSSRWNTRVLDRDILG